MALRDSKLVLRVADTVRDAMKVKDQRTPEERKAHGLELREQCPLDTHAVWEAPADRPDPVALLRERSALKRLAPQLPALAADARCRVVTVFDVLANQFIEELRGEKRHGSCGMGIWETVLRHRRGCALTLGDIDEKSTEELIADLRRIRDGYFAQRLAEKAEPSVFRGWREGLIFDENLLLNAAEDMREGIKCLRVINSVSLLKENFETFIFEGAQGLLLDGSGDAYAPYTTPSATGSRNIRAFHAELGVTAQETALPLGASVKVLHGCRQLVP